jgi:hypothetical protein
MARTGMGPAGVKTPTRFAKVENSLAGRRRCAQKCSGHAFRSRRTTSLFSTVRSCMSFHTAWVNNGCAGRVRRQSASTSIAGITPHCGELAVRARNGLPHSKNMGRRIDAWLNHLPSQACELMLLASPNRRRFPTNLSESARLDEVQVVSRTHDLRLFLSGC